VLGRYDQALQGFSESFTKAFALSRIGRFKDASAMIQEVRRGIDNSRNIENAAAAALLEADFALDRGDCPTTLRHVDAARTIVSPAPPWIARRWLVLADHFGGVCEARSGRVDRAQARLDLITRDHLPAALAERWWVHALEGEIALATGKSADAAAAFAAGEPPRKMPMARVSIGTQLSIFANDLLIRDGRARALVAQGRDAEAIQLYRDLLTPSRTSKWTAMLEPRYVLALAKLLDKTGQRDAARVEYQRFLDLWKNADPGSPEVAEAKRRLGSLS
jgi:tetratricopeptide (TPR) repeat protein